ncbi:MAG: GAF and ANTAR domain-containing protein [Intrasporangium sp.]|uniref:GAF and ANTAR domain-containing protein n=1 Tax=Intrasporangium sp. TaxID=1925024 RepID=UPI003F7E1A74
MQDESSGVLDELIPALHEHMTTLRKEIRTLRWADSAAEEDLYERFLAHMEAAQQELRTAEEEVLTQQRQLQALLQEHRNRQWLHERLVSMLPLPVVRTDDNGLIRGVNPAAAALLDAPVDRLVHKPIQAFVETSEREGLRRDLGECAVTQGQLRRVVTLTTDRDKPQQAELIATATGETGRTEVTCLILTPTSAPAVDLRGPLVLALTELTLIPVHAEEEHEVLSRVARICQSVMGPGTSVTVSVGDPNNPKALASTDRIAQQVDGALIAAGEGPSHNAWLTKSLVWSADLVRDPRWPSLSHYLQGEEARTVLALPVQVGDELFGVVNVYNVDIEHEPQYVEAIGILPTAIAAVLHELGVRAELQSLSDNLRIALDNRAVIEQAKGVLMGQHRYSADEAFHELTERSMHRNEKLRVVAREVVRAAMRDQP